MEKWNRKEIDKAQEELEDKRKCPTHLFGDEKLSEEEVDCDEQGELVQVDGGLHPKVSVVAICFAAMHPVPFVSLLPWFECPIGVVLPVCFVSCCAAWFAGPHALRNHECGTRVSQETGHSLF